MNKSQSRPILGKKYRDSVTGFKGTVTALTDYLHCTSMAFLEPKVDASGKFENGQWIYIDRLEKIEN